MRASRRFYALARRYCSINHNAIEMRDLLPATLSWHRMLLHQVADHPSGAGSALPGFRESQSLLRVIQTDRENASCSRWHPASTGSPAAPFGEKVLAAIQATRQA